MALSQRQNTEGEVSTLCTSVSFLIDNSCDFAKYIYCILTVSEGAVLTRRGRQLEAEEAASMAVAAEDPAVPT